METEYRVPIALMKEVREVLSAHWFDGDNENEDVVAVDKKLQELTDEQDVR